MSVKQAVVLAGGLGTRLRPITHTIPKPMALVDGVPFLELLVKRMKRRGFDEAIMLIGHLGEQIHEHFGDGSKFGIRVKYSIEKDLLGTGGALKQAEPLLEDGFMVLYGDSYLPIEYAEPMAMFEKSGKTGLITVYSNNPRIARNNVALDDAGLVLNYRKKEESPGMSGVEAGVFFLRKDALAGCPTGKFSLEETVFPKLIKRGELLGWMTGARFWDIGTPEGLEEARGILHDAD
ncbi:MAG: nucleotidyltransferase family protein [Euryarchaeota archaeon]|nr:nucleotidyltransferase family protein [Euryarchaeota archaeon]